MRCILIASLRGNRSLDIQFPLSPKIRIYKIYLIYKIYQIGDIVRLLKENKVRFKNIIKKKYNDFDF